MLIDQAVNPLVSPHLTAAAGFAENQGSVEIGTVLREELPVKNVAVVGASGAVGELLIRLLEERSFPVA